jgi:hypothetical protein
VVFWVVMPCSHVGAYLCFGGTYRLYLKGWRSRQHIHLKCLVTHLHDYMASQPRRPQSTFLYVSKRFKKRQGIILIRTKV